jgi:hypothetical protein
MNWLRKLFGLTPVAPKCRHLWCTIRKTHRNHWHLMRICVSCGETQGYSIADGKYCVPMDPRDIWSIDRPAICPCSSDAKEALESGFAQRMTAK